LRDIHCPAIEPAQSKKSLREKKPASNSEDAHSVDIITEEQYKQITSLPRVRRAFDPQEKWDRICKIVIPDKDEGHDRSLPALDLSLDVSDLTAPSGASTATMDPSFSEFPTLSSEFYWYTD
jgi:hypothetical protein